MKNANLYKDLQTTIHMFTVFVLFFACNETFLSIFKHDEYVMTLFYRHQVFGDLQGIAVSAVSD